MTVAIGLVCSDGVVVASDSMASAGAVAQVKQKCAACGHVPVVWTASGSVYVIEEVHAELTRMEDALAKNAVMGDHFRTSNLPTIRETLAHHVRSAMKKCYEAALPLGLQPLNTPLGPRHPFATSFLLLGYGTGGPYFLEVAHDGQLNWHHQEKFYAVGSGGDFATVASALMAHYIEGAELTVDLGLRLAFRTIETTCRVSSSLVALPVQLAVASKKSGRVLNKAEVDAIQEGVAGWKTLEAETLRGDIAPPEQLEKPPTLEDSDA